MRSILVDNSTLTAVQRLTGDIPVTEWFPIEGDVAAFDGYIQALLFYDEVACVDDYKEEFKGERKGRFEEVRFLNPNFIHYDTIDAEARAAAHQDLLSIKRGNLEENLVGGYLRQLDLELAPAWYMQSSAWFLKLRIMAAENDQNLDKYGALMTSIFNQLNQNKRSQSTIEWSKHIEDSRGTLIANKAKRMPGQVGDINGDVISFAASLNWLNLRSRFYLLMAMRLDAAICLHPIRHSFLGRILTHDPRFWDDQSLRQSVVDFFSSEADDLRRAADKVIGRDAQNLALPFFAAWAVGYAGNPKKGYEHVLDVRHSTEARTLRSHFRELEALADDDLRDFRTEASKLRATLAADLSELKRRFGGPENTDKVTTGVSVLTLSPTISTSALSEAVRKVLTARRRAKLGLFRSIANDLLAIPTLREISDRFRLSRRVVEHTEFFGTRPRVEAERFRRSSSSMKQPL